MLDIDYAGYEGQSDPCCQLAVSTMLTQCLIQIRKTVEAWQPPRKRCIQFQNKRCSVKVCNSWGIEVSCSGEVDSSISTGPDRPPILVAVVAKHQKKWANGHSHLLGYLAILRHQQAVVGLTRSLAQGFYSDGYLYRFMRIKSSGTIMQSKVYDTRDLTDLGIVFHFILYLLEDGLVREGDDGSGADGKGEDEYGEEALKTPTTSPAFPKPSSLEDLGASGHNESSKLQDKGVRLKRIHDPSAALDKNPSGFSKERSLGAPLEKLSFGNPNQGENTHRLPRIPELDMPLEDIRHSSGPSEISIRPSRDVFFRGFPQIPEASASTSTASRPRFPPLLAGLPLFQQCLVDDTNHGAPRMPDDGGAWTRSDVPPNFYVRDELNIEETTEKDANNNEGESNGGDNDDEEAYTPTVLGDETTDPSPDANADEEKYDGSGYGEQI